MASIYDVTTADVGKSNALPASIIKFELRENGGDSTQWNSYGDVDSGELNAEPRGQAVAAGATRQFGMMVTCTGNIVASGVNVRTALINVRDYVTDMRVTTIEGYTYTLAQEDTGIRGDLTIGEALTGSNDVSGAVLIPFTWTGYMTMAKYLAIFAAPA